VPRIYLGHGWNSGLVFSRICFVGALLYLHVSIWLGRCQLLLLVDLVFVHRFLAYKHSCVELPLGR
jgi:hypothetical protein